MRCALALSTALALILARGAMAESDTLTLVDVNAPSVLSDAEFERFTSTVDILTSSAFQAPPLVNAIATAVIDSRGSNSPTARRILNDIDELGRLRDASNSSAQKLHDDPADPLAGLELLDALGETILRLGRLASLTVTEGEQAQRAEEAVRRYTADKLRTLRNGLNRRQAAAAAACPLTGEARLGALSALEQQVSNAGHEVDQLLDSLDSANCPEGHIRFYEKQDSAAPLTIAPTGNPAESGRWGQAAINRLRSAFSACRAVQMGANPA